MAPTKEFPTADVLSTVTGRLMGDIGGVYAVLNWMTGESLFTHQLPRVSREMRPVMIAFRPELTAALKEADQVNRDNWREWLATWVARYGKTIAVPKFTADEHEQIDALSEAEVLTPDRIIIVKSR